MEVARRSPVVMLLLCLLFNDALHAFVINPRSKEADELTEALKVIQRAKRRLLEPEPGYYWGDEVGVPYGDEEDKDTGVLEGLFAEGPEEGVLNDGVNGWDEGEEAPENEVSEPGAEAVDKAELEDMFEDKKEEEKKEYDPSEDMKKREGENTLSDAEVENLLDTAKETEVKVLSEGDSGKPVAKEEIKQVLAVAEPNGDGTEKVKVKEDNWLITPEKTLHNSHEDEKDVPAEDITNVNKEWLMNLEEPVERNIKKKRSGDPVLAEAAAREREEEEEDADLTYIKEFIELEDDENNNLANALNLATLSQVERTDKYIPLEVQYLKQSIKDEETIQSIKESLGIGTDASDDEDEDEEEEEEEAEEELLEPEIPIEESPAFDDEEEEETEDEIHKVLSEKFRQFLLRTAIVNRQQEALHNTVDGGEWYNLPVNPSDEGEEEKSDLNPFLRDLLEKMVRSGAISKRGRLQEYDSEGEYGPILDEEEGEEDDLGDFLPESEVTDEVLPGNGALVPFVDSGVCPAVSEHVDNCAYVRSLGMSLDEEALDLCNRHQLCYTCGSYYGLSADTCDKGFLGEADRLCEGEEECKDEAAGLYFFMLKDHSFTPRDQASFSCAADCTYNYILGLEARK